MSLPTLADVVAYEEQDPRVRQALRAGYPRFIRHPLVRELAARLAAEGRMEADAPLLPAGAAARDLCAFLGLPDSRAARLEEGLWTVRLGGDARLAGEARAFLQHTGCGLSSREAEDVLKVRYGNEPYPEERAEGAPREHRARIRAALHAVYGTAAETDIRLFRSGMNAFYAGFRALKALQLERGRDLWIQLGWLYLDTARLLERFAPPGAAPVRVLDVLDLGELAGVLDRHGRRVAAIVTETPTNPLVQTADLAALRAMADRHGAALVLDPTLASPHNVHVLPYADLHINSLTKYAAAEADVMMGALALNAESRFYDDLLPLVDAFGTPPGAGDLARMAAQIPRYPETIAAINRTTPAVAAFLERHPMVRSVHWALRADTAPNYLPLLRRGGGPGGIITFTLNKPLAAFHDPSRIVKSPSFGARFTLMCPFMYLAHYDMVRTAEGRARLRACGLDPDLVRLSVGLEPAEHIIAELDRTLR